MPALLTTPCSGGCLQLLPSTPAQWFTRGCTCFKLPSPVPASNRAISHIHCKLRNGRTLTTFPTHSLSQLLTLLNSAGFLNLICFTCLMILCKSLFQVLLFSLSLNFCIHSTLWQGNPWVHCLLYREPTSSGNFEHVSQAVHLRDIYPCPAWTTECLALIHLLHIQDFVVLQCSLTL